MKAFGQRKSKRGFTLIELLIVMVILAILAGVIVLAVSGVFKTTGDAAYTAVKSEIENAVTGYSAQSAHPGQFPILTGDNGSITVGSTTYNVINFSELLIANGGLMKTMPTGLYDANSNVSNCGAGIVDGCETTNHYVWYVDSVGNLQSRCFGSGCTSNTSDGYQDIWP